MRKLLLALLLPATALVATGCGDSCTNKGSDVKRTTQGAACSVATQTFTVNVTPACQSCADDAPKCDISPLGSNQAQLDVQVRECDSNKHCSGSSCAFGSVSCSYTAPAASGTISLLYNAPGAPATPFTVTVGAGSSSVCTL